ncbi:hypothetical protein M8J77_009976 [Diaphorina citri]|nr:hypothetical protein M8J77_009976 [Diaphorina citri]
MQVPTNAKLASLDVKNLFPNVNIGKVIEIIENTLTTQSNLSTAERKELIEGLKVVHNNNYFQFNNVCYKQYDGCPMGSPLSPLLSEFYMIEFEKEIFKLPPYLVNRIVYLYRYVDDVIILWSGTQRVLGQLMTSINQIWDNLSLDLEYGGDSINFLDLTISLVDQRHKFKIYRKDSFSDVIIPADSYHCHQHKMAVFRNYYNRLLEIPMDAESFEEERNTIRTIGLNNGYTPLELSKVYKGTVRNKRNKLLYATRTKEERKYIKMPFIKSLQTKINPLLEKYKAKPAFSSTTIRSLFSRKDKIPMDDQSGVYSLECECGKEYIGMTRRSLKTRINEHQSAARNNRPEKSNFAKHIIEEGHDAENATHRILWTGKNFKEITYHEQIEIHKSVESGKNINEIVDTVPYLVYRRAREQLMPNDGTVPPPSTDHCQQ